MAYSSGFSNPFGFVITPWVKRLIVANVAVFLLTAALTGLRSYLVFTPALVIPRVWTPVTYMFVHVGLFHLLFNMLTLFFFGPPLEERWGSREFVKFYLLAGLGGVVLSFVFLDARIAGASAAVYGVMVAFAMYWPDNPIYIWGIFPVKAKYLVGFLVALSLFYSLNDSGAGIAHLAHLGGAIAAFAYLKSPLAPSPWGGRPTSTRKTAWKSVLSGLGRADKMRAEQTPIRPVPTVRRREPHRSQDEVDQILDKISEGGIASLTPEERARLEEASRKFRAN